MSQLRTLDWHGQFYQGEYFVTAFNRHLCAIPYQKERAFAGLTTGLINFYVSWLLLTNFLNWIFLPFESGLLLSR